MQKIIITLSVFAAFFVGVANGAIILENQMTSGQQVIQGAEIISDFKLEEVLVEDVFTNSSKDYRIRVTLFNPTKGKNGSLGIKYGNSWAIVSFFLD